MGGEIYPKMWREPVAFPRRNSLFVMSRLKYLLDYKMWILDNIGFEKIIYAILFTAFNLLGEYLFLLLTSLQRYVGKP